MKLKTVEVEGKTFAQIQDGKPVYVDESGKDIAFDAPGTVQTISRLNGEAKGHRERAEAAEKAVKAFDGIEDPAAAVKALETVKGLDDKQLIDAGEVEKVKAAAIKAVDEKYAPVVEERDALKGTLNKEMIGGRFSRSKFIADKIAVPVDMIEATFGARFSIEDGAVVATDASGNRVYSKAKPGEAADFDEALEILVDSYAHKDHILKGLNQNGGGANGGGPGAGAKRMSASEFDALDPKTQAAKMAETGFELTE